MAPSSKTSGADHPMREAVIAAMDCDWSSVARTLAGPAPEGRPIWYQKHMWHHMVGPIGYADFAGQFHPRLPDPRSRQHDRLLSAQAREPPRSRISGWTARRSSSSARRTGSAARRRWSTPTTCSPIRAARSPPCAPRSALPSIRRCSPGRPGRARPTAPGRRTGIRRSRRAPASARPTARVAERRGRRGSPNAAGLIMSGWRRTGSGRGR